MLWKKSFNLEKKMKPKILLTNDDGIQAPGLRHLYNALKDLADITIVAPLFEKSGAGMSMTLSKPIKIQKSTFDTIDAWSITGTPTDCVKLALNDLLDSPPDLIVSGINRGSNAGRSVFYSGTVGGVIEGVFRNNLPGIAFSSISYDDPSYSAFEKYAYHIVKHVIDHSLPEGSFLNVSFPAPKSFPIKGCRFARQGKGFCSDNPEKRINPEGISYYWLGFGWKDFEEHPESDVALLEQGYITAVPINVKELTDHDHLENHGPVFHDYFGRLSKDLCDSVEN